MSEDKPNKIAAVAACPKKYRLTAEVFAFARERIGQSTDCFFAAGAKAAGVELCTEDKQTIKPFFKAGAQ